MFLVVGYLVCNFCMQIFVCSPPSKFWHEDGPGHCIDTVRTEKFYASLNIVSNLIIFVLPLPIVWHLQLSVREKIGIFLVFTPGAIMQGLLSLLNVHYY